MATSSSSTSAAANPSYKSYQFFINHRAVDVRKTFARSLYLRLREKGLTAFLEDEERQGGCEISSQLEHVIRTASVHVAILSPRYAESDLCLKELVMMLQSDAPVIPVFYRVRPADVRWVQGFYGQALESLAKKGRYDTNTTMEWRKALQRVANNSGFELESSNGKELEVVLLDKLVKHLSEMVPRPVLHVADYPTGLDLKLKDFEDRVLLQKEESRKPQILGIVGLGGVGKSTLAKFFFNRKRSGYSKSCFLADVRDHASKGSLHLLQRQLLKTLNGGEEQVNTVHEGKKMLGEPLKRCDTLIVFDDVDNVDQVNAFLPVHTDKLNSRSLILITSRDRGVLRNSRVEDSSIYKLSGLNEEHSQELFCFYAFNRADPRPAFQHLVDQFLGCCHGLPLCLKIVGALLYNKQISEWEDELEALKEILPSEMQKTLFRSYCSLDKQEKEIFLDIACFFIGENRDSAITIWNGSDWREKRRFLNLQDKSLVEVDDWNRIRMHDHVRDLGREVAATSSPPRLWQAKRVIDYLSQQSFETTVRGIRLVEGEFGGDDLCDIIETKNDGWNRILRRLQILHIEGSLLERILTRVKLPNLLWLSWQGCPYSSLPSLVTMKKLRVLRVDRSELKTLSDSECESSLPASLEELHASQCVRLKSLPVPAQETKLRFLDVSGCSHLEELPTMETFLCLEELVAYNCVSLKSIRGSAQATKLRSLDVSECSELEELPSLETMVSLRVLWAKGCMKLKSIQGLAQATKLKRLDVSGCSELEELPGIERLVSLEELSAARCKKLKTIQGLGQATNLRILDVSGCSEVEELPSMEKLVSLVELRVGGCLKLKSIRGLTQATELKSLVVSECSELEELPSLETMVSLQELCAEGCMKLKSIHGLAQATKLIRLNVSGCSELEELPDSVGQLTGLQTLDLNGCSSLQRLPDLFGDLVNLQNINLNGCSSLQRLPYSVGKLWNLQSIDLRGCSNLQMIPNYFGNLEGLERIDLSGCSGLHMLPNSFRNLKNLRHLDLSKCSNLEMLPYSFGNLRNLQYINLSKCSNLQMLPNSLENLKQLQYMNLSWCSNFQTLPNSFGNLRNLRHIDLSWCSNLQMLPNSFGNLTNLQHINLSGCSNLPILPNSFGNLIQLKHLYLGKCYELSISNETLGQIRTLEALEISGCYGIEVLPPQITNQQFLREMYLFCPFLRELPSAIGELSHLEILHLESSCLELLEMGELVSLEELQVRECVNLKSIQGLAQMTKLRRLDVANCSSLKELSGVEHLMSLEKLNAAGCPNLQWGSGVLEQLDKQLKCCIIK